MRKIFLTLLFLLSGVILLNAQSGENPFAKYGFNKVRAYTSSKGEFEEFHDNKDIVEIGSVLFDTKTNQVIGYAEEVSEVAAATPAMSIDPLCEKYYWISPYAYCLNNPIKFIDPDGKDVYGFDINTGKLSRIEITKDITDKITLGTFSNDVFTASKDAQSKEVTKGVIGTSGLYPDASATGLNFSPGLLDEGLEVMGFLSFNSNIEFSAWGYSENGELGLSISPWISNQTIMNPDGSGKMTSYDKYLTSETVGDLGKKAFNIHTHPGSVNGLGGYGKPSPADVRNLKLNPNRPHYILSFQEGLTQYFVNGFYKKVNNVKGHY